MKIKDIITEEAVDFDENFIRSVARDQGVDLSGHSRDQLMRIHKQILDQAIEYVGDPDMGLSADNIGQEYYDVAKQYFSN